MYGKTDVRNFMKIKTLYTAFSQKHKIDYAFTGESHNFWEMVIVTDGEVGVTAGSDVFVLKKGQAIFHEPMEFHNLWSEGNSSPAIIIFSFSISDMPPLPSKIFEIESLSVPNDILVLIRSAFECSKINVTGIKRNQRLAAQIAIKNLELFILHTISQKQISVSTLNSRSAKNYSSIVNILENNLNKNLSVADIAKLANMSEVNLKKTFSCYSGVGVINYFNRLKVNAAIDMIKSGMSIKEISASLGFLNQNYFSTVFKRITGRPPTYYK